MQNVSSKTAVMPVQQKVLEQRHYKVAFRSSSDLCVSASVWIPAREPRLLISLGNNDPLSQHALRLHGANSWGTHFRTYSYSIPRRRVRARRIDAMSGILTRFPCSAYPHMSLDSSPPGQLPLMRSCAKPQKPEFVHIDSGNSKRSARVLSKCQIRFSQYEGRLFPCQE